MASGDTGTEAGTDGKEADPGTVATCSSVHNVVKLLVFFFEKKREAR